MYPKKIFLLYSACILAIIGIAVLLFIRPQVNPHFPHTFVINLDERKDRLEEVRTEFAGWPVPIERVSAVKYKPGWKGCSASHLKCIQLAKERRLPWVVVIEDDCILKPNAVQNFSNLLPFLWSRKSEWDIFNGGVTSVKDYHRVSRNPSIFKAYGQAANFYLVHEAIYDRILQLHPKDISDFNRVIDLFYPDNFRLWVSVPYLTGQRPNVSDIESKDTDYTDLFNESEQRLLMA